MYTVRIFCDYFIDSVFRNISEGEDRWEGDFGNMIQEKLIQICTLQSKFQGDFEWQAAGMSYLIHTANNTFLVIDGGYAEDVPHLLQTMRKLSGEDIPHVALWVLTHPHADHYLALATIAADRTLRKKMCIDRLCFQIPENPILPGSGCSIESDLLAVRTLANQLAVPVLTPHTGLKLDIDGIGLQFFFTPEDHDGLKDPNELSLVFQIIGPNRTIMITGDAYERSLNPVCWQFWDELKSDVCQLAHHGLNGGSVAFYTKVAAPTVLIPVSASGDRYVRDLRAGYVPRLFAERMASEVIPAYHGDAILLL